MFVVVCDDVYKLSFCGFHILSVFYFSNYLINYTKHKEFISYKQLDSSYIMILEYLMYSILILEQCNEYN